MRTLYATLLVAMPLAATAEEMVGNPSEGLHFAREICAACHYVEPDGPPADELPPRAFSAIAADPKTTVAGLRAFLQSPHMEMPDFILTQEQTDDLIAYILRLRSDAEQ